MPALIFNTRAEYDAFEARMAIRLGLPVPGRNAATGALVDPDNLTGKGWTVRATNPIDERDGDRVMTKVRGVLKLDAADQARVETRQPELARFGPLPGKVE